ncbi:SpoIIE family protein phosphatase [Streptomyces sp. S465]|uniref:SpoIIE family protein phosphatase n=1 Tax=Streptomyces sp. S465 TaxID=2979468 RepID=UPI0022A88DC8|nr:SpoIIE family protein phosphatase [Streptomyces sp. S465]WAP60110.1 SpoIIE family protein phosphatase [Streptomyces sp. S465]
MDTCPDGDRDLRPYELAVARSLLGARSWGMVITDLSLRVLRSHTASTMFGDRAVPCGSPVQDFFPAQDTAEVERHLRCVAEEGHELADWRVPSPMPAAAGRPRIIALTALRLEDEQGRPVGLVVFLADASERWYARHRLELLHRAANRIGGSLDVSRTAQDLADLLAPSMGDLCAVFLAQSVLVGEVPPGVAGLERNPLLCAAVSPRDAWPETMISPGARLPTLPGLPEVLMVMRQGEARILDRQEHDRLFADHPALRDALIAPTERAQLSTALFARGKALGSVSLWRTEMEYPFDAEDSRLLREIASRAALSVDNARRFTREHRAAVTLQYSLLPLQSTRVTGARTSGVYLPASGGTSPGGDWFDVIPLSSMRIAMVTGDAAGHGVQAATMMGRLRAAVRTLANLDLPPDELLINLDDLVQQVAAEATDTTHGADGVGASCLYAIYDPVAGRCAMASAGHPAPAVARPGGQVEFLDLDPGPPLGVGGHPFEVTEVEIEPGSVLALYTDGLVEQGGGDAGAGRERLRTALVQACGSSAFDVDKECRRIVAELTPAAADDDATLLLAHTHAIPADRTACWEFPADPETVTRARALTVRQLHDWGLAELAFSTELVVSELITNAIRYAGGPIQLGLIRDRVLTCEVSDAGTNQPHLRRARLLDEGGRGLFLVAQLTTRWGSRYRVDGKTIWTEQSLA